MVIDTPTIIIWSMISDITLDWQKFLHPLGPRMWCCKWGVFPSDYGWVQDGSLIFQDQCAGRVPVVFVWKLLVTWCSKGVWDGTRGVTSSGNASLLTRKLYLPTLPYLYLYKSLHLSSGTRPAPRHMMINQSAFVGVATTSWDPTGAAISANPVWYIPFSICCNKMDLCSMWVNEDQIYRIDPNCGLNRAIPFKNIGAAGGEKFCSCSVKCPTTQITNFS